MRLKIGQSEKPARRATFAGLPSLRSARASAATPPGTADSLVSSAAMRQRRATRPRRTRRRRAARAGHQVTCRGSPCAWGRQCRARRAGRCRGVAAAGSRLLQTLRAARTAARAATRHAGARRNGCSRTSRARSSRARHPPRTRQGSVRCWWPPGERVAYVPHDEPVALGDGDWLVECGVTLAGAGARAASPRAAAPSWTR